MSQDQASPPVNTPPALRLIRDEAAPPDDGQAPRPREPFVMISHEVFRAYAAKAGPIAWSVFTALVFHADATGRCFPAHTTLGTECGIKSRRTVIDALKRLADLGMIRVEQRRNGAGAVTSNEYEILIGMHVQQMHRGSANNAQPSPQNMHSPCAANAHELEPVNYTHLTKTVNTPLPPEGERAAPKQTERKKPSSKERSVPWPEDLVLSDELRESALRAQIRPDRIERVFQKFKAHAHANDTRKVSWSHYWVSWVNSSYQDGDRELSAAPSKPGLIERGNAPKDGGLSAWKASGKRA